MRHVSERVAGKNYRPLGGRPLYHHIIDALLACPLVSAVVIDTDSDLIRDDAARAFPQVEVLDRPKHLRDGTVPMNEVLLYDLDRVPADVYLQTHATNPLLRPETIDRAISTFRDDPDDHDSLFGVTRLQTRLWTPEGCAINHDPALLLRTQDLAPIYEENSCIYLFSGDLLRTTRSRIGRRPILFEISREEAWDIDEEADFEIVSALFAQRMAG
jgi:CMP-N-acetylneuraminic acid synthetase